MEPRTTCPCACHKASAIVQDIAEKRAQTPQSTPMALIDQQIEALEARIRELRELRNTQAPIAILPRELLTEILKESARSIETFTPNSWKTLVQLSSVCKLWREVAVDSAAFWSCIPIVARPTALRKMLQRSKQHPFSLRYDQLLAQSFLRDDVSLPNMLFDLLDASRLRDLHMRGTVDSIQQHLEFFLSQDLPSLRSLNCWPIISAGDHLHLPPQLLAYPKPSLRHLELKNCIVDWDAATHSTVFPLSNITTLSLDQLRTPPPLNFLLGLLTFSPQLRHLELAAALRLVYSRKSGENRQPIRLPQDLRRLSIMDGLAQVSDFLSWVEPSQAKPRTEIGMACRLKHGTFNKPLEERQTLLKNVLAKCQLIIKSVSPSRSFFRLQLQITPALTDYSVFLDDEDPTLLLDSSSSWQSYIHLLMAAGEPVMTSTLLEDLHSPGLQRISVEFPETPVSIGTSSWRTFFEHHPTVRSLSFQGDKLNELLDALRSYDDEEVVEAYAFPSLDELNLEAIRFSGFRNWKRCPQFTSLEAFVVNRVEWANCSGLSPVIPLIKIKRCVGLTHKMVEALRLLVPGEEERIIWDGVEEYLDDDEADYSNSDGFSDGETSDGETSGGETSEHSSSE